MRLETTIAGLGLLLSLGCSGDDDPGAADAGVQDAAAAVDSGVQGPDVTCGAATCNGAVQYCREAPTGPCEAVDGGTCGDGEEVCNIDGLTTGCTPSIPRTCVDLPPACDNCVCLIDTSPCGPGGLAVTCSGTARLGLTARCPPP